MDLVGLNENWMYQYKLCDCCFKYRYRNIFPSYVHKECLEKNLLSSNEHTKHTDF